ncbi:MAG: FMN-binding protein [Bacteroidota bacterium]
MLRALLISISLLIGLQAMPQKPESLPRQVIKYLKKHTKSDELLWEKARIDSASNVSGAYYSITSPEKNTLPLFLYTGKVNSCRSGGCSPSVNKSDENAIYEHFTYLIVFDHTASIRLVKVTEYNASHGAAITAGWWLKQFKGYKAQDSLRLGKEIDAVSGASISADAILKDIQKRTKNLHHFLKKYPSIKPDSAG